MPMLTTVRIGLPVAPSQMPLRTRSANSPIAPSTSWTSGTTLATRAVGADGADHRAAIGAQGDVQHGAVLGDVDPLAAEHRVAALDDSGRAGDGEQGDEHGVVDALLRVVDAQVADGDEVALGAPRIGGEQLAQVVGAGSAVSASHCGVVVMSTGWRKSIGRGP